MPRTTHPRKTWEYSKEFKIKAVKLTLLYDYKVKDLAESLGIHRCMLSRWRKEFREGRLHGDGKARLDLMKKKKRTTVGVIQQSGSGLAWCISGACGSAAECTMQDLTPFAYVTPFAYARPDPIRIRRTIGRFRKQSQAYLPTSKYFITAREGIQRMTG